MPTKTSSFRRHLLLVFGLTVSVVFLYLAFRNLEIDEIARVVSSARLLPWLPLAVSSYLVGHLIRGQRCRLLVSREAHLPLSTSSNIVVLGYSVNNILPARLGEFARAGLLSERSGLPYTQALTVTFAERLLDGLVMLFLLGISLLFVPAHAYIHQSLVLLVSVFLIATALIVLFVAAPHMAIRLASRSSRAVAPGRHDKIVRLVQLVTNGVAYLRVPRQAVVVAILSLIVWLFEAGMFFFLLPTVGLKTHFWWALSAMTLTNLAILLPSSPGFVGPYHYFCMQALIMVGVPDIKALSYAIIAHASFYVPVTLWGVGVLFSYSAELKASKWWTRAVFAGPVTGKAPEGAVTLLATVPALHRAGEPARFERALAEASVPLDALAFCEPERERVTRAVALFVSRQLESLPVRLKMLMIVGLTGFRLLIMLRYLRGFARLSLKRRIRIVEAWTYGRVGLARQLFRAIRSTALLAFYEQPEVLARLDAAEGARPCSVPKVDKDGEAAAH